MGTIKRSTASTISPVALTAVSGVITPNASIGRLFRYVATSDVVLATPTGGYDGAAIDVQVYASGGDRVLTAAGSPIGIPSGDTWWGRFSYNAELDEWLLDDAGGGTASDLTARDRTVYAVSPPASLSPIAADGITDDSGALQALLAWIKSAYDGGQVRLPSGVVIKCNSGLNIPARVQLVSDESTTLDFTGIGTGTAITVNDNDFTPLVGVSIAGPNSSRSLVNASIGVSVTGARLRFYNLQVKEFGRGVDMAHSDTWLASIIGGSIWNCGTCVYLDNVGASASNAGEEMVLDHVTLYNSTLALNVTGNGVDLKLTNCSIDYCTTFGAVTDSWVYFTGCHLESDSDVSTSGYLFAPDGNAKVSFANCDIIMGGGTTPNLCYLFDPTTAPFNFGVGQAHFANTKIYAQDPGGGDTTQYSEQVLTFPSSSTSMAYFTPFPVRWAPVTVDFCAQDFRSVPNNDRVYPALSGTGYATVTLTAPSNGSDRWVRVRIG